MGGGGGGGEEVEKKFDEKCKSVKIFYPILFWIETR